MATPLPVKDDPETEVFAAAVREGIVSADAGRTLPYEAVRSWLLSWGTSSETLPPRKR